MRLRLISESADEPWQISRDIKSRIATVKSDIHSSIGSKSVARMDPKFHMNTLVARILNNWDQGFDPSIQLKPWEMENERAQIASWYSMKEAIADFAVSLPYTTGVSAKSGEEVDQVRGLRNAFGGGRHYDDILIPLRRMWNIQHAAFGRNAEQRDFKNIVEMLNHEDIWDYADSRIDEWLYGVEDTEDVYDRDLRGTQYIDGDPEYMRPRLGQRAFSDRKIYNTLYYRYADTKDGTVGWIHHTFDPNFKQTVDGEHDMKRYLDGPQEYFVELPTSDDLVGPFKGSDAFDEAFEFLRSHSLKLQKEAKKAELSFDDLFGRNAGPMF